MDERGARTRRSLTLLSSLTGDAFQQLAAHGRQHALTLGGIVWGSASLILLLSLGAAFNQFLDLGARAGGDRWLMVRGDYTVSRSGGARSGRRVVLKNDDLDRLEAGVASATAVAAEVVAVASVETPRRTRATAVAAASPALDVIQNHRIARGRWLDEVDEREARRVAVLGHDVVEPLFGDGDPLGRTVQIEGVPFDVVGVMQPKGFQLVTWLDEHDNMIFVPLSAGQRALGWGEEVGHLLLNPARIDELPAVREEVRTALAPLHNLPEDEERAFSFFSVPEMMGPVRKVAVALHVLLGLIGTVTLAIAGVGVANLMTAIAAGRRLEFAMRRAFGARRSDLVMQLLVESVVVVCSGGLIGVALGLSLVAVLNAVPLPDLLPPPRVVPSVVVTTFVVLAGTGLGAGVIPARMASQVEPGIALRAL
jgi:putative ABC transport system permease protein